MFDILGASITIGTTIIAIVEVHNDIIHPQRIAL
jgi:hypothetical protein